MCARRHEELVCWQRAEELKNGVYELIETSKAIRDLRFRDQLTDSAASATANLAEAFGYYRHKEAARFARIAKASLVETRNHLADGIARRYWTQERVDPLMTLSRRAIAATVGWIKYLSSTREPPARWEREDDT